jgi:hypothetical protein
MTDARLEGTSACPRLIGQTHPAGGEEGPGTGNGSQLPPRDRHAHLKSPVRVSEASHGTR